MIRIGFWGISYYNYSKEAPKIVLAIIWAPMLLQGSGVTAFNEVSRGSNFRDLWATLSTKTQSPTPPVFWVRVKELALSYQSRDLW